jgi:lantibiotic modifying enzyme
MWIKLFENNETNVYKLVLNHIALSLSKHYSETYDIGLLSGKSGIALFFFYYARFSGESKFYDLGYKLVEEVISTINNTQISDNYVSGLSGIGWMINHIYNSDFIGGEIKSVVYEFDNYFVKSIDYLTNNHVHYDLFTGINGYLPYILSRGNFSNTVLEKLIFYYTESSHLYNDKYHTWTSYFNNKKVVNLGLAHGVPSNIILLLKLLQKTDKLEEYKDFIYSAVSFLFNYKYNNYQEIGSLFPTAIGNKELNPQSRLAWCNGDLGVIYSLFETSESYSDKKLKNRVLRMLDFEITRVESNETFIFDAIFCHGSSGVAHIFNRLYQKTKIENYKTASKYWYQKTLDYSNLKLDFAGYKTLVKPNVWIKPQSVLEGIAGIGLSLISAVSDIEPAWDEALLLS